LRKGNKNNNVYLDLPVFDFFAIGIAVVSFFSEVLVFWFYELIESLKKIQTNSPAR